MEASQSEEEMLSARFEALAPSVSVRDTPGLSSLERLPRDLMWKMFECTPESVFLLRMASKSLLSHVDKYLMRQSISLVKELRLFSTSGVLCAPMVLVPKSLVIQMEVPSSKIKLFETRLKLRSFPMHLIMKSAHGDSTVFWLTVREDDEGIFTILGECIGGRIGKTTLTECSIRLDSVMKLLDGVEFGDFNFAMNTLTDAEFEHLLEFIKVHKFKEITIDITHNNLSREARLVLSSLDQSVCIYQRQI